MQGQNSLYNIDINPITRLPSKFLLNKHLDNINNSTVIALEINEFEKLNDFYGNEVTNRLLMTVAKLFIDFIKEKKLKIYHYTDHKFIFCQNDIHDFLGPAEYEEILKDLIELFRGITFKINDDLETELFCTVGLCFSQEDSLRKALKALNIAKMENKNYFCYMGILDPSLDYVKTIKHATMIRKALENDHVKPYFQPIFNRDKEVVKYETLVRIVNGVDSVILPNVFLEDSKRIRRYSDITKTMFSTCFNYLRQDPNLVLSLNISFDEMMDGDISAFIVENFAKSNIANQIIFEILEDGQVRDFARVDEFLSKVRRFGAKVAIDDFGSGYSNFSYILDFKPDYLKIDGSLVKNVDVDKNAYIVLKAIVIFAQKLGIKTIAEFVHSKEVFDVCYNLGVDEFQGFYLGIPKAEFLE